MEWYVVLLGVFIGLIMISANSKHEQKRTTPPAIRPRGLSDPVYPTPRILPRPILTRLPLNRQVTDERVSTKTLLVTWRNSIVGLVKLAQRNLTYAEQCLEKGDCTTTVEAALTSTENISRALLHCYGEKPEPGSGQEEALRMLARRLTGTENTDLEKIVEEINLLHSNRIVHRYLSTSNLGSSFLFTKARAAKILDSASKVVTLLTRIIGEHFATEIPELSEICPKCHALDVGVLSFGESTVNYTCNQCRHSWIQPRTL